MTFRILFAALLATAIGQSVVLTTLPSLGRQTGLTELQVAVIMSSSAFIFALGTNVWSRFIRTRGHRRILMIGLSGYTLGTLLFACVWQLGLNQWWSGTALFLALLVTRSLQSSIMSATPPSAIGYAISVSNQATRVSAISKVTSANNLGQILGPSFAGALVGLGLLVPLWSVALLTILALLLVWRGLPELPVPAAQPDTEHHQNQATGSYRSVVLMLVLMSASVFCAMAMMQQSLGFFFIDHYELTPVEAARQVGLAMMVSAVCSLSVQLGVVQRTAWRSERLVLMALPALAVAYLLMYLHHSYLTLYAAMALLGLGMGTGYPSIAATATNRCQPGRQAAVTGLITATPAMGYIIGPPVAALFYAKDPRWPFLVASLLLAVWSLVAIYRLRAR